ncbi:hypothetical protein Tsubulata_032539 [Turnera subulata]|uniref:Uncharacterized protein n=1 Tax=Turnera subulata TaxID=218843 RepID=A0A9Q0FIL2_9ROSI|nr:hypothetical protein Tsubulata_032539 [Turnera subulata]
MDQSQRANRGNHLGLPGLTSSTPTQLTLAIIVLFSFVFKRDDYCSFLTEKQPSEKP